MKKILPIAIGIIIVVVVIVLLWMVMAKKLVANIEGKAFKTENNPFPGLTITLTSRVKGEEKKYNVTTKDNGIFRISIPADKGTEIVLNASAKSYLFEEKRIRAKENTSVSIYPNGVKSYLTIKVLIGRKPVRDSNVSVTSIYGGSEAEVKGKTDNKGSVGFSLTTTPGSDISIVISKKGYRGTILNEKITSPDTLNLIATIEKLEKTRSGQRTGKKAFLNRKGIVNITCSSDYGQTEANLYVDNISRGKTIAKIAHNYGSMKIRLEPVNPELLPAETTFVLASPSAIVRMKLFPVTVEKFLQQAKENESKGRRKVAADLYAKTPKGFSQYKDALFNAAGLYMQVGLYDKSIKILEELQNSGEKYSPKAFYLKGKAYLMKMKLSLAVESYKQTFKYKNKIPKSEYFKYMADANYECGICFVALFYQNKTEKRLTKAESYLQNFLDQSTQKSGSYSEERNMVQRLLKQLKYEEERLE